MQHISAVSRPSQSSPCATATTRRLLPFEAATVVVLVVLALLFARAENEAWGIFLAFKDKGLFAATLKFYQGAPSRLLEPLPMGIAWLIGHGAAWSIGVVYALLITAKYFAARWAVRAFSTGPTVWVLATIGTVMLPWASEWRGHNMAQQLASVFLLVTVGAILRLDRSRSMAILAAATALLSLVTYEGLILCTLVIPLILLDGPALNRRVSRAYLPIAAALCGYVIVFFIGQLLVAYSDSPDKTYHRIILVAAKAYTVPLKVVATLYRTAFLESSWTLAIPGIAIGLASPMLTSGDWNKSATKVALTALAIPWLAAPYAISFYLLSDIERIGLPIGFGFFLLFAWIARVSGTPNILVSCAVVLTVLFGAAIDAYNCYADYALQRVLLDKIEPIVRDNPNSAIIVRDWTGRYGDYYTFNNRDVLPAALVSEGYPAKIVLCTPPEVNYVHPYVARTRTNGTLLPRCDAAMDDANAIAVDIRNKPNDLGANPIITMRERSAPK